MNKLEKINFRQSRDFGETFNVSVKFLRQNFKLFFQSLIFIGGPFVLISAVAGAFYQSGVLSMATATKLGSGYNFLEQFGITYFLFVLAAIVAGIALLGTVYSFMINYMEKGPGAFTVNDVARTLTKNIGNILSVFFILTLLVIVIVAICVGITILFFQAGTAGAVVGVLLLLALIFGGIILFPPLMWQLSVVYLVKMQEGKGVFESFGRTRQVMRSNFWWTWVIMVCASMAVGIIAFVFAVPQAIYQMVLMFSHLKGDSGETPISFLIVATICTFCSTILYSVLHVISAFHYYSLAEKKDGVGLMERIDEIGNTANNNVEQQY
jgi:hypothetical protein